jgi:hypothetical protein
VYVRGGGLSTWEASLRTLLAKGRAARYEVDGGTAPLPASAQAALGMRPAQAPSLTVDVGGIVFACHFFGQDEVELDFSPAEVDSAERFAALLSVGQAIGEATGCDVVVTPENEREVAFLRYDAGRRSVVCTCAS